MQCIPLLSDFYPHKLQYTFRDKPIIKKGREQEKWTQVSLEKAHRDVEVEIFVGSKPIENRKFLSVLLNTLLVTQRAAFSEPEPGG